MVTRATVIVVSRRFPAVHFVICRHLAITAAGGGGRGGGAGVPSHIRHLADVSHPRPPRESAQSASCIPDLAGPSRARRRGPVATGFAPSGRLVDAADEFGRELRRRRTRAGLTQRELAMHVQYSRETVAAVERGRRFASRSFAVRCDEVLGTGGVLTRLWPLVE